MRKIFFRLGGAVVFVLAFVALPTSVVKAEDGISINLRIEGPESTVLDAAIQLPFACEVVDTSTTTPSEFFDYKAICALQTAQEQGLLTYQVTDWRWGFSLDSINDVVNAEDWSQTWIVRVNNASAQTGIDSLVLGGFDELLLTYGPWPMEPMQVVLSTSSLYVGDEVQLTAQVWDDETGDYVDYVEDSTFWINGISYNVPTGTLRWVADGEGEVQVWVEAVRKTRSLPVSIVVTSEPVAQTQPQVSVNFNLRYQDELIFSNQVVIPTSTSIIDNTDTERFTTSTNVLTALIAADATSTEFIITDLQYYEGFQSFYLNCIESASPTTTSLCGSWNYVVDGVYPSIGMNSYELSGGETVFVYFSNPWKITASTSTFPVNTTTTLETWRYNYDDLEAEWIPDPTNFVDISVTNPESTGWWDATITTATTTTNEEGFVDYVFSSTGTFYAAITSVDWSKWSDPIILSVFDTATSTATSTARDGTDNPGDDPNPGGGNPTPDNNLLSDDEIQDAVDKILNFLQSYQDEDGKIVDGGTTDWVIMSYAANGQYADDISNGGASLLDYAKQYELDGLTDLNICASYPRHLLALLAGGVAVEDELVVDLVDLISTECYADSLYGLAGFNDDVFALIALLVGGLSSEDVIIQDIVNTIKQGQTESGAFNSNGFAGADITGISINALDYARENGVDIEQAIFDNAKQYLKNEQLEDGGWVGMTEVGDPMTTAWAMMGVGALGEGQGEWETDSDKNPWYILVDGLNDEGYYETEWNPDGIDWFATKYAVPALLGKSWPVILDPRVDDPVDTVDSNSGNNSGGSSSRNSTQEIPTSTVDIVPFATSTLDVSTSTIDLVEEQGGDQEQEEVVLEWGLGEDLVEVLPLLEPVVPRVLSAVVEELEEIDEDVLEDDGQVLGDKIFASETSSEGVAETEVEPRSVRDTARLVFIVAFVLGGALGLYLVWRFLKTLL